MKKKLIITLVIFSAVAAGIFYLLTARNIGEKYVTVEIEKGEIVKYVEETGTVSSGNIRSYYGNSLRKVETIEVELGDHVEEGQLLIKFEDNSDTEIQKVEKQIEALEATYKEALSGTDFESINNAKLEISRIRSSIALAKENKDRMEELYSKGVVAEIELENAVNDLEQLQNSLAVAQNSYNLLAKGLSENMRTKYEAEIDVLLLSLEILEKEREDSMVYADFDGIVTEMDTFEGDIPYAGLKILEIQDPSVKNVLVDFMAEDALLVKAGMEATVADEDLNLEIGNLKVEKVHPKAFIVFSELGVEENRQRVEINLPESSQLPFGLKVGTKIIIEESKESLLIPQDAVYEENMKDYVDVLVDGGPVQREVVTGMTDNGRVEIKEGLEEGEKVILKYGESQ
ncbi:HlyD family secretion protein [Dethiosulfatibacter aminovorans DSM 17477]|uniref:HlyD family secretion protein n=1 Tax=Dethiosulfatibacter aminovorans DSM 17477 TaxID=1121476 RepID=A0A1M6JV23_9FIRM|nr:efflux RND transporter periplasmic adaptor subunit [Dethiosulfatibacter aminovorans]SHJ50564.1 HlyD family secretion protein [Dethiosulfatibacter aminovorans DSM 17477]